MIHSMSHVAEGDNSIRNRNGLEARRQIRASAIAMVSQRLTRGFIHDVIKPRGFDAQIHARLICDISIEFAERQQVKYCRDHLNLIP